MLLSELPLAMLLQPSRPRVQEGPCRAFQSGQASILLLDKQQFSVKDPVTKKRIKPVSPATVFSFQEM